MPRPRVPAKVEYWRPSAARKFEEKGWAKRDRSAVRRRGSVPLQRLRCPEGIVGNEQKGKCCSETRARTEYKSRRRDFFRKARAELPELCRRSECPPRVRHFRSGRCRCRRVRNRSLQ